MTAYISAYCINYVFDRSLPKEVAFEIENVYEQKIKGKKSEIITFHANLKTEYSSVKSINITPDEFKAYRVGDSIKYKLYEGFLGTPYLKKIKWTIGDLFLLSKRYNSRIFFLTFILRKAKNLYF